MTHSFTNLTHFDLNKIQNEISGFYKNRPVNITGGVQIL